jgi:hypothetical protein
MCELRGLAPRADLTDAPWALLAPCIPGPPHRATGRGRPRQAADRAVRHSRLWGLRPGAAWADRPERFPPGARVPAVPSRGERGGPAAVAGNARLGSGGARPERTRRTRHRRDLCGGETGGAQVGQPRRGTRTQLMRYDWKTHIGFDGQTWTLGRLHDRSTHKTAHIPVRG